MTRKEVWRWKLRKYSKEFRKKLRDFVDEINLYEEGDTGDIPGYYIDEDLNRYVEAIIELFEKNYEKS